MDYLWFHISSFHVVYTSKPIGGNPVLLIQVIIIPLAQFYHERSRERAKYGTVLCIALQNPDFTGFLTAGLEKPNFDVIFSSGILNLLFDGLTYNTK